MLFIDLMAGDENSFACSDEKLFDLVASHDLAKSAVSIPNAVFGVTVGNCLGIVASVAWRRKRG